MNRQARLEGSKEWTDYGNVTYFQAIRDCAIQASRKCGLVDVKWIVEARCMTEPESVDTFEVQTSLHAEILEPRKGDV